MVRQDAGEPVEAAPLLRELRAHAELLSRLAAVITRLELDEATTRKVDGSDDPLAKYLDEPDKWHGLLD